MTIREVELPAVGKKYTIETQAKGRPAIVMHNGGKREIHHFPQQQNVPDSAAPCRASACFSSVEVVHQTSIMGRIVYYRALRPRPANPIAA